MQENARLCFRPARKEQVPAIFALIMRRVDWMDTVGIHQWNDTHYDRRYPPEYYRQLQAQRELFVLEDPQSGKLLCVGALLKQDERWPEPAKALYLHHFASDTDARGSGSAFLRMAEAYARDCGMDWLRLDSAVGNQTLEDYYTRRGYEPAGSCVDGLYRGILRQKPLG